MLRVTCYVLRVPEASFYLTAIQWVQFTECLQPSAHSHYNIGRRRRHHRHNHHHHHLLLLLLLLLLLHRRDGLLEAIGPVCNPLFSNQLTIHIAVSTQTRIEMDGAGFESR
jgi:hypothetical protein